MFGSARTSGKQGRKNSSADQGKAMHAKHADVPSALTGLWVRAGPARRLWRIARSLTHRRIFGCRPAVKLTFGSDPNPDASRIIRRTRQADAVGAGCRGARAKRHILFPPPRCLMWVNAVCRLVSADHRSREHHVSQRRLLGSAERRLRGTGALASWSVVAPASPRQHAMPGRLGSSHHPHQAAKNLLSLLALGPQAGQRTRNIGVFCVHRLSLSALKILVCLIAGGRPDADAAAVDSMISERR